jgi:tetratricopeptide (TPR) repeat protein
LNNQGLLKFLEGDLRRARQCYTEICERVPNNIIFTYRLGLCLILEGFKNPKRTLLGKLKPDPLKVSKGLELLEHCLKLGTERPVGRQKCLVIRKIVADVYEKTGRTREAKAVWRGILEDDPACAEATFRVKGAAAGRKLAEAKNRAARAVEKIDKRRKPKLLSD